MSWVGSGELQCIGYANGSMARRMERRREEEVVRVFGYGRECEKDVMEGDWERKGCDMKCKK